MTELQARIDRMMELDKHRTPGEWYRDVAHAIRSYVNPTLHQVSDQVWPFVNLKESDFQFILNAPEMVSIIKELQAQLSAKEITINETWEALLASRALREKMKQELSAKDEELTNMIERHDYEVDECVQDMHQLKQKLVAKDALIAELQKENEWLPIADAPRDNTPVIVWHEHKTGYKAMYIAKYDHGSSISRVYSEIYGNVYNIQPTHFLKLPEPPKGI